MNLAHRDICVNGGRNRAASCPVLSVANAVAAGVLAVALCVFAPQSVEGRLRSQPAVRPAAKGLRWCWPRDSVVKVNIAPEFSLGNGQRVAIEQAFRRWERAGRAEANGSGVHFEFKYATRAVPSLLLFQVQRGRIASGGQALTVLLSSSGGLLTAVCTIDERVTDPSALSNVMAHEIGHTFGLEECDACEPGASVMTRYGGDYNDTASGRNAPSEADNDAVRANIDLHP